MHRYRFLSPLTFCVLFACQALATDKGHSAASVIERYFQAYNAGDNECLASILHPEITWLSIVGDETNRELSGREAMLTLIKDYREQQPLLRSKIAHLDHLGPWVYVRERVSWPDSSGQQRQQSALSIYEVRDGMIRRVWYYPSD